MVERPEKYPEEPPWSSQPEKTLQTADPRPHSTVLDALRGIGILGVVVTHTLGPWYVETQNPLIIPVLNIDLGELFGVSLGPFCLGLFFLLSGYLLTWTESSRASRGNYSLRSYVFRRALRLLPAYYAALALIFLLRITGLLGGPDLTLTDTLAHLAVLQTLLPFTPTAFDPAYWYLTSELMFYALLPLLVLKIRGLYPRLALFGVLLTWSITIQVAVLTNAYEPYAQYLMRLPLTHLWLFVAGVLLRTLVERLDERRPGGTWPILAFSLFAGSLVLLILAPDIPFVVYAAENFHILLTFWLAIPFFAAALLGSPVLSRVLSWRLLGFIGMISYSLYLLHGTIIRLVRFYALRSDTVKSLLKPLDGVVAWVACAGYLGGILVVIGAIAYLSYRYIESPFMRYKPK